MMVYLAQTQVWYPRVTLQKQSAVNQIFTVVQAQETARVQLLVLHRTAGGSGGGTGADRPDAGLLYPRNL